MFDDVRKVGRRLRAAMPVTPPYFKDSKRCAVCSGEVMWKSAEIHHVVEHQAGGQTTLDNGVLVHGECHPKGQAAKDFALELQSQQTSVD